MWWWAVAALAAEGDPEEAPEADPTEPEVIEITAPDEELGSAIDGIDEVHAEVKLGPQLEDWVPLPGNLVRGRFVVRPLLGGEAAQGRFAVTAGFPIEARRRPRAASSRARCRMC